MAWLQAAMQGKILDLREQWKMISHKGLFLHKVFLIIMSMYHRYEIICKANWILESALIDGHSIILMRRMGMLENKSCTLFFIP